MAPQEPALGLALRQLSGASGSAFRRRWLDDHVLSDAVLGQAVPQLVTDFAPEYLVSAVLVPWWLVVLFLSAFVHFVLPSLARVCLLCCATA